jgi:uncharacterized membrane protein
MRPSSYSPLQLILFVGILSALLLMLQLQLFSIAFERLGLSESSAFLLLISSLLGSMINLPLFTVRAEPPLEPIPPPLRRLLSMSRVPFNGRTLIAVNVGGCLIPVSFSIYLLSQSTLPLTDAVLTTTLVSAISYAFSRPIAGLGVGMPILIAPLAAAVAAITVNAQQSAPLAYIGGTLGVLIGADLLRLNDIRRLGAPVASIGGAGTFDGIFLAGIVAVLLAQ